MAAFVFWCCYLLASALFIKALMVAFPNALDKLREVWGEPQWRR